MLDQARILLAELLLLFVLHDVCTLGVNPSFPSESDAGVSGSNGVACGLKETEHRTIAGGVAHTFSHRQRDVGFF